MAALNKLHPYAPPPPPFPLTTSAREPSVTLVALHLPFTSPSLSRREQEGSAAPPLVSLLLLQCVSRAHTPLACCTTSHSMTDWAQKQKSRSLIWEMNLRRHIWVWMIYAAHWEEAGLKTPAFDWLIRLENLTHYLFAFRWSWKKNYNLVENV